MARNQQSGSDEITGVLPYHFKMTEQQVVCSMYILTLAFCILGLFVPG